MTVEDELRRLVGLLRRPRPAETDEDVAIIWPGHGQGPDRVETTLIRRDEDAQIKDTADALERDPRFEYLAKPTPKEVVVGFARGLLASPGGDHVKTFVTAHAHEIEEHTIFIPIEALSVTQEFEFLGVRFLPVDHADVPEPDLIFDVGRTAGCVAAVQVSGTGQVPMVERARFEIGHALNVLRVAFGVEGGIHTRQLRFRMGQSYSFEILRAGVHTRADVAWQLGANAYLFDLARAEPVAALPATPTNDLEKHANVALTWMERAYLEGDPLVGTLYLYFALEALLGSHEPGPKGEPLAFRQMILGHIAENGFHNPIATQRDYELIRSASVHGEEAPTVTEDDFRDLLWRVRKTFNQYLSVARDNAITRRSALRKFLDNHTDRDGLATWIRNMAAIAGNEKVFKPLVDYLDKVDEARGDDTPDEPTQEF